MSRLRFERLTQQMSHLQDTSASTERFGPVTAQIMHQEAREIGFLGKQETESPKDPVVPADSSKSLRYIDASSPESGLTQLRAWSPPSAVSSPFALSPVQETKSIPEKGAPRPPTVGGRIRRRRAGFSTPITGNLLEYVPATTRKVRAQNPARAPHNKVPTEEVPTQEVPTQFVNDLDIPASILNCYIAEFAARLVDGLRPQSLDEKTARIVADILPDSLRHYALMMGYSQISEAHKDVMLLVYKHRR